MKITQVLELKILAKKNIKPVAKLNQKNKDLELFTINDKQIGNVQKSSIFVAVKNLYDSLKNKIQVIYYEYKLNNAYNKRFKPIHNSEIKRYDEEQSALIKMSNDKNESWVNEQDIIEEQRYIELFRGDMFRRAYDALAIKIKPYREKTKLTKNFYKDLFSEIKLRLLKENTKQ